MRPETPKHFNKHPKLNTYFAFLTDGCNLACQHCWLTASFQRKGSTANYLSYELFVQAIEEGLPLGLTSVKITGGEPLLHPNFIRIVDFLRVKNLNLTLETNGMLLTRSLAHYLKERSTLRYISLSLDGATPETHDAFRGVRGSFDSACQAVRNLVEVGYRPQVIMSLHRGNIMEIEPLVRLATALGAGSVKLGIVQPNGRGELLEKRGQTLDVEQIIEIGKWVRTNLSKNTSIPVTLNWPMAFFDINKLMHIEGYQCDLFGTLGILPSGHLSLCGLGVLVPDLCLGMLGQDRVEVIWDSHPILLEVRDKIPSAMEGICAKCLLQSQCNGGCVAQNYRLTGRLTASYWLCREAEDKGLFPLSRRRS